MKTNNTIFIVFFAAFLTGCTSSPQHLAPVVDGWQQPNAQSQHYVVQKGDTIYSVAWSFGMDYRDRADINQLNKPYSIQIGQTLAMGAPIKSKLTKADQMPVIVDVTQPKTAPVTTVAKASTATSKTSAASNEQPRFIKPARGEIVARFGLNGNKGIDIEGVRGESVVASSTEIGRASCRERV